MTDLPHDELFSAYLDGELSAAEQAEIEQLLATSPAARQLLDELRALSSTLQSLPQEKVGEDLGPQVLRVAERRMLSEGEPGDLDAAPVPLARSIFRRFVNRRTVTWLGLTVAIAVMITIHDHWNADGQRAVEQGRELARAPESSDKPTSPPTIQAAPGNEINTPNVATPRFEKESKPVAAPAEPPADGLVRSMKTKTSDDRGSQIAVTVRGAEGGRKAGANVSAMAKPAPAASPSIMFGAAPSSGKAETIAPQAAAAKAGQGALVVRCDISRDAANKRAFDKLLDANGILEGEPSDELRLAEQTKEDVAEVAKQQLPRQQAMRRLVRADREDFVYVEATPAQIGATLAGLKAQPNVFLSVSVKPAEDEASQSLVRRYAGSSEADRQFSYGIQPGFMGRAGGITTAESQPSVSSSPAAGELFDKGRPAEGPQGRVQLQRQLSDSTPRQQVLFVLRVAGNGHSSPTATVPGKVKADAPASPSSDMSKPKRP